MLAVMLNLPRKNSHAEFRNLKSDKLKREHRREGFETANADRIFESTFTSQIKNS